MSTTGNECSVSRYLDKTHISSSFLVRKKLKTFASANIFLSNYLYNLRNGATTEDIDVTLKREPHQSPEWILLGGLANDTANPHSKARFNAEVSVFNAHEWNHPGSQRQSDTLNEHYALLRAHTIKSYPYAKFCV